MSSELTFGEERAELEAVLSSRQFARSPTAAQILRYVCERYFAGEADDIKEYTIAVEALGRPVDFDKSRDSVIRVEAHRLRKRLQEYYKDEGVGRPLQITMPSGSYAPVFVCPTQQNRDSLPPAIALPQEAPALPQRFFPHPDPIPAPPKTHRGSPWYLLAVIAACAIFTFVFWPRPTVGTSATSESVVFPEAPISPQDEVRILAGNPTSRFVDNHGNVWTGDRYFTGGDGRSVPPRPIAYTQDPSIYYFRRRGEFTYKIPLRPRTYELRLHFAETSFGENNDSLGGETARLLNVFANGKPLLMSFDVLGDAGGSNTANIKVFRDIQPASDGFLHLRFAPGGRDVPFVNAIEVLPAHPGQMRPVRIRARNSSYVDANSLTWGPDRHYKGGLLSPRPDLGAHTADEGICQTEHFGNFSYQIPVAQEGRYAVTLRFCEGYFGAGRPGGGGPGSRVFDVALNNRPLLSNFDLLKEAPPLQVVTKRFPAIRPNAQGKLLLEFTPIRNYAVVNGIEVVDESVK